MRKNLDMCHFLISKGATIDAINSREITPLRMAIMTENLDICQLLISNGAAIDTVDSSKKNTFA